ncbi:ABC transporter permease [Salinicoccus albus]|uniref:ABC transporter permease n=1 Tax=Salinicoccus albus TaxID=418756 RepID=UPI0003720C12|nr:ABC transporter permease [Salinicoccus albus]
MTVFKGILLHFWKYKYLILILLFVFFGFAYSFTLGNSGETYESQAMDLKVVDNSNSALSEGFIEHLERENNVESEDGNSADREALEEEIFLNNSDGVIIVKEDAERKFLNNEAPVETISDERNMTHIQLETLINQFFTFLEAEYETSGNMDTAMINEILSEDVDVQMHESVDVESENNFSYMYNFVNFAGYWSMLFLLMIVGNVMAEFNAPELRQRISSSPMTTRTFMVQMNAAQIVVGLFISGFMFLGGILLRVGHLEGIPLGKMAVALILITAFILSIHYVVGAMTTNKFIINGLANFIAIGMAFLSGIMIPLEVMGETTQNIARYLPLYYFTQIYAEPDISWAEAAMPMFILVLYTVAFLIIGMILENKKKMTS